MFARQELLRRFVAGYFVISPVVALGLIPFVPHQVIGAMFMVHGILVAPSLIPNRAWFGPVIKRFDTKEKVVCLTLDDGPDATATPQVLALLEEYDAKACFFVIGRKVREHPELVRQIAAAGHELGNHTDSHRERWFWAELWKGVAREVDSCSKAIFAATGVRPRWFRSPAGMTSPFVHPVLREREMQVLGWSVRAKDAWISNDMTKAARRVIQAVRPGAVLLLHPEWRASDGTNRGMTCLETVLRELRSMGYRCVLPENCTQPAPQNL